MHSRSSAARIVVTLLLFGTVTVMAVEDAQPVDAYRGDFTARFLLSGELVAEDAVQLVVPNANIWPMQVRWLAEDGVEVQQGDVLVEFDNSRLASELERLDRAAVEAGNQLASVEATVRSEQLDAVFKLEQKEADLSKAKLDSQVPPELLARKVHEERKLALERAELDLTEARNALALKTTSGEAKVSKQAVALSKAEVAARRARDGIEILTLSAPRDGILLVSENPQEGRTFQTGDSTWPGTTIAGLPELSSMIVEARLFDVDDGRIRAGLPVTAVVDAFPETVLAGEIIDIDNIANEASRFSMRRVFRARVRLAGIDLERMRPGMSVKVVAEERFEDVLLLPRSALTWSDSAEGPVAQARLADSSLRPVRLGPCSPLECIVAETPDSESGESQ